VDTVWVQSTANLCDSTECCPHPPALLQVSSNITVGAATTSSKAPQAAVNKTNKAACKTDSKVKPPLPSCASRLIE